ncbi:MAG: PKD domain-containing protein [DPANN group archaeon]|nr:PKD domain-containing protein [DPANN group archaeon]
MRPPIRREHTPDAGNILSALLCLILLAISSSPVQASPTHTFLVPENGSWIDHTDLNLTIAHGFGENATCNIYLNDSFIVTYAARNSTIVFPLVLGTGQQELVSSCVFDNSTNLSPSVAVSIVGVDLIDPTVQVFPDLQNKTVNVSAEIIPLNISADEPINLTLILNNQNQSHVIGQDENLTVNLSIRNGSNDLSLLAKDRAGNIWSKAIEFTALIALTDSCQNGRLDPGEENIDCGGSCNSCVPYDIVFDKESYELGDQVDITVIGRPESTHNITLAGPDFHFSSQGSGIAGYFLNPERPGTYTVRATYDYLGNQDIREEYFEVTNQSENLTNLQAAFNANPGTIAPGESITFYPVVGGGVQPYRYQWDFNEDYVTDSTEKNPQHLFPAVGKILIRLTVIDANDQEKSAERYVSIKQRFHVNLTIKENVTGRNVSAADVELDSSFKTADDNGRVSYDLFSGTYLLSVSKQGYEDHYEELTVDKDLEKTVHLRQTFLDITAPIITVKQPYEEQEFEHGPVMVTYQTEDATQTTCKEQQGIYANLFTDLNGFHEVDNDTPVTFSIPATAAGTNYFKIICQDLFGNSDEASGSFIIRQGTSQPEAGTTDAGGSEDTANITDVGEGISFDLGAALDRLDGIRKSYAGKDELTNRVIDALGLREDITQKEKELKLSHRDLFNIQYKRINDEEKAKERDKLLKSLQSVENSIIEDVTVKDSRSFVRYNNDLDVEDMTRAFASSLDHPPDDKELEQWIAANQKASQGLTVSTFLSLAELTSLDGTKRLITLVEKDFTFTGNQSDLMVLEVIPKNFSASADDLTFLDDVDIIKDDPLIKVKAGSARLVYYREGFLDLDVAEQARTLLTYTKVPTPAKRGLFSGFATFLSREGDGGVRIDTRTSILASLILSLVVYLIFNTGILNLSRGRDPEHRPGRRKAQQVRHAIAKVIMSKEGKRIRHDLRIVSEYVEEGRHDRAKDLLDRCEQEREGLEKKEQAIIGQEIRRARQDYALSFLRRGIGQAQDHLSQDLADAAGKAYARLREAYALLPKESQRFFGKDLMKLAEDIDRCYISKMVKDAHRCLDREDHGGAYRIYGNIQVLFKKGSERVRAQTHRIAMDLVARLQNSKR